MYFLPYIFGPVDLEESIPLVFEPHFNGLALQSMNSSELNPKLNLCNGDGDVKEDALKLCNGDEDAKEDTLNLCNSDGDVKEESIHNFLGFEVLYELKVAALKAANSSHAPYSKCPYQIALMTTKGNIYTRFYIESAAFNRSLSPLQAAIVAFHCQNGENH